MAYIRPDFETRRITQKGNGPFGFKGIFVRVTALVMVIIVVGAVVLFAGDEGYESYYEEYGGYGSWYVLGEYEYPQDLWESDDGYYYGYQYDIDGHHYGYRYDDGGYHFGGLYDNEHEYIEGLNEAVEPVVFPAAVKDIFSDFNIIWAVAYALGVEIDTPVTQEQLDEIVELHINWLWDGLQGVQYLTSLAYLSVESPISGIDLSPLVGLTSLHSLDINGWVENIALVAELSSLEYLALRRGLIDDLLPFAELVNLRSLDLRSSQISDVSALAGLVNLHTLDLSDNFLINNVTSLSGLTSLQSLNLSSNSIRNVTPLAGLNNLRELDLSYNNINDITPLAGLSNLRELDLTRNNISSIPPLTGLTYLESLNLALNRVNDIAGLTTLTSLQELILRGNRIDDIAPLSGLINMKALNLGSNQVSDISPLANLVNLESLILDSNRVNDITPIGELVNLSILQLGSNQIQDITPLIGLTNLGTEQSLVTMDWQNITLESIPYASPLVVGNPIIGFNGELAAPTNINDNGVYSSPNFNWAEPPRFTFAVSWQFGHNFTIGDRTYLFSGSVRQPLMRETFPSPSPSPGPTFNPWPTPWPSPTPFPPWPSPTPAPSPTPSPSPQGYLVVVFSPSPGYFANSTETGIRFGTFGTMLHSFPIPVRPNFHFSGWRLLTASAILTPPLIILDNMILEAVWVPILQSPVPSPSPTHSPTPGISPPPTQSPTPWPSPSPTPIASPQPPSPTPTPPPTPSPTPDPTPSPSPPPTPSPSPDPTPSLTPLPTPTPDPTPSPTPTPPPNHQTLTTSHPTPTTRPDGTRINLVNLTNQPEINTAQIPRELINISPYPGHANNIPLSIAFADATVTFSAQAMRNLYSASQSSHFTIAIDARPPWNNRPVVGFTLEDTNGNPINASHFAGAAIEVSIPYAMALTENPNGITALAQGENDRFNTVQAIRFEGGHIIVSTREIPRSIWVSHNFATFPDIANVHFARAAIEQGRAREMVHGFPNGMFRPHGSITRAEFVQLVNNILNLPAASPGTLPFMDVRHGAWYQPSIMAARQAGLLDGLILTNNRFVPNQAITRQEMGQIMGNIALRYEVSPIFNLSTAHFHDSASINSSYTQGIARAINAGFLDPGGIGGGAFSPHTSTTRAQAALLQMNMLRVLYRVY